MNLDDTTYPAAFANKKNDTHWRPGQVTWGEIQDWMLHPKSRKDVDGYILATLEKRQKVHIGADHECDGGYHRDGKSIVRRSAVLMIDIDTPDEDFDVTCDLLLSGHAYILHTTFSSTPSEPRYRLLVPVDRDMLPHEYVGAVRSLSQRLGDHQVDPGTYQHTRFMYRPSAKKPEWFDYTIADGDPMSVDDLLDSLEETVDTTKTPKPGKNKRNPFEIEDPIGAFNRVYTDWDELIEVFELPYERESDGRWHLVGSKSQGGLTTIPEEGFVNSFHAGDPAFGLNHAFDLVRLHWFLDLDEAAKPGTPINRLPSVDAMKDVATKDPRVVEETFKGLTADFGPIADDDDGDGPSVGWRASLQLTRQGKFIDNVGNWDLIMRNDVAFSRLYFNVLNMATEVMGDLPWREVDQKSRSFDAFDFSCLRLHIEREYGFRPTKELMQDLINIKTQRHQVNPVLEYLERLEWDGVPRVETCLPGTLDTQYNRLVARKVLVGAVARMYRPGCKWDHTLVLFGPEGFGKTTWIERMANVGYPERDSRFYTLGRINDKDTLLAMHMSWIVLADEGHSLRKSDNDALKEFLTRTTDVFRLPYERETVAHPRKCVIWSTTNDDTFLRRQEGNRRFLMVRSMERFDIDAMTPEYVDQLWAEAVVMFKAGERIWLNDEEGDLAAFERMSFVEEDSYAGVIQEYLERKVPENWWQMSKEARASYIRAYDPEFDPPGTMQIDRTCTHQLWEEAFGQRVHPSRVTLRELSESLKRLGWVSVGTTRIPGYGPQATYVRREDVL